MNDCVRRFSVTCRKTERTNLNGRKLPLTTYLFQNPKTTTRSTRVELIAILNNRPRYILSMKFTIASNFLAATIGIDKIPNGITSPMSLPKTALGGTFLSMFGGRGGSCGQPNDEDNKLRSRPQLQRETVVQVVLTNGLLLMKNRHK